MFENALSLKAYSGIQVLFRHCPDKKVLKAPEGLIEWFRTKKQELEKSFVFPHYFPQMESTKPKLQYPVILGRADCINLSLH